VDEGENEQKHRHEKQSRGFGGVDRVVVLMLVFLMLVFLTLVVGSRVRRNGGVHAVIVAFSVVGRWSLVAGRWSLAASGTR
jgi:hypothetical protein